MHGRERRRSWPGSTTSYGALKKDAAEAVVELLRPVRERHAELSAETGVRGRGAAGGCRAGPGAWPGRGSMRRIAAVGLLPAA